MTDLDAEVMSIFTKEECLNATEATKVKKLNYTKLNKFSIYYEIITNLQTFCVENYQIYC